MVLIPAGEFEMGDDDFENAKPVHTVYLDAFYIDKYEVTNARYWEFVKDTDHKEPEGLIYTNSQWQPGLKPWLDECFNNGNQPVVCIDWEDAMAYAKWAKKRLPTESEWEKSARGGRIGKKFAWGDDWPPPKGAGNFADRTAKKNADSVDFINGYDDGHAYTAPVGNFSPNDYGLYDIVGNIWEWCADWYSKNYYANSPRLNPSGPETQHYGLGHVLRGGAWLVTNGTRAILNNLRVAYRTHDDRCLCHLGFRCAMNI